MGITTWQLSWARENVALAQRNSADKISRLDAGAQPHTLQPLNYET